MPSQNHYLRLVRDLSLVAEDEWGCECVFADLNNLRVFQVRVAASHVRVDVSVPLLYPQKPPIVTVSPADAARARTPAAWDSSGRLVADAWVGAGWQPWQGLPWLLQVPTGREGWGKESLIAVWRQVLCFEFGALLALPRRVDAGLAWHGAAALAWSPRVDVRVLLALDWACEDSRRRWDPAPVMAQLRNALDASVAPDAIAQLLRDVDAGLDAGVGLSLGIVAVDATTVRAWNLGTVGCFVLQPNHRRAVQLSRCHDALDELEAPRLTHVVKHSCV